MSDNLRKQFDQFIGELFTEEDDVLRWIKNEIERNEMPAISVAAHDGYLLQWLMRLIGAKKVVEIGTLGGYSGVWIGRALPADGKLYTLELEETHAQVARASFERAGLSDKIDILLGSALENLNSLSSRGPFDMVFIDADKESYPDYLAWAVDNLRSGGLVTAHNAFRGGNILNPVDEGDHILVDFLNSLADNPQLDGFVIPIGDGMAVARKV